MNRQVDAALSEPNGVLTSVRAHRNSFFFLHSLTIASLQQREIIERENSVSDLKWVKTTLSADLLDSTYSFRGLI